jgi:hypothetical protein
LADNDHASMGDRVITAIMFQIESDARLLRNLHSFFDDCPASRTPLTSACDNAGPFAKFGPKFRSVEVRIDYIETITYVPRRLRSTPSVTASFARMSKRGTNCG